MDKFDIILNTLLILEEEGQIANVTASVKDGSMYMRYLNTSNQLIFDTKVYDGGKNVKESYRHIRPSILTHDEKEISRNGVTLRFVERGDIVEVFASVCNGDNFRKSTGRYLTENTSSLITVFTKKGDEDVFKQWMRVQFKQETPTDPSIWYKSFKTDMIDLLRKVRKHRAK